MIISNHLFQLLLAHRLELNRINSATPSLPQGVMEYWNTLKSNSTILCSCMEKAYESLRGQTYETSDLKLLDDIYNNSLNFVYTVNYNVSRIDTKHQSLINHLYYNFLLELNKEYKPPNIKDSRKKYNAWRREIAFQVAVSLSKKFAENKEFESTDKIMYIINKVFDIQGRVLARNLCNSQGKSPPTELSLKKRLRKKRYSDEPLDSFDNCCCLYHLIDWLSQDEIIKEYKKI